MVRGTIRFLLVQALGWLSALGPVLPQADDDSILTLLTAETPAERNRPIPHFVLRDSARKLWSDYDLRGRVTIISLWRPDCPQCQDELANLSELFADPDYRGAVRILAFALAKPQADSNTPKSTYPFPVLLAHQFLAEPVGLPRTWILDPNGLIRDVIVGQSDLHGLRARIRQVTERWRERR